LPTYEYACRECGEHTEVQQSFSDPALTECPACGGPLRKVFGNIAITFKGSGFYKTDSRSSNGKAKSGAGKSSEGGSGSDGGSSDSSSSSSDGGTTSSDAPKSSDTSKSSDTPKSSDKPANPKPAAAAS
jgi:putative FmdB family regulatory protein